MTLAKMWTITYSYLIFTLTFFVVTGSSHYHCCQNELCPIDCIRCDGKATCYDLSDELGCSNETDTKLLSYEKPPVFVPTILAVIKAQLRREKVELSYRFPDRNCFETFTSSPDTTTQTPVWLQLLIQLKESLGITTTTTTTTTEMPIWKMLLNKLRAEQNGEVYTFTPPPTKQWEEKYKTTTPIYLPSQTPPWRRTAIPPIKKAPTTQHHTTTEIPRQTKTPTILQTTAESINQKTSINQTPNAKATEEKVTTNYTEYTSSTMKEQTRGEINDMISTSKINEKATTSKDYMTSNMATQTSTDMSDQTTKVITEPTTSERKEPSTSEINNQILEQTTEQTVLTSTLDGITPGTIKQTVFFTRPQQQIVTKLNQQEVVTPIAPQLDTSNLFDNTTVSLNKANTSQVNSLSSERSDSVISEKGMASIPFLTAVNDTLNSSFVRADNLFNVELNVHIETNITKENELSNITRMAENSTQRPEESTIKTSNVSLETNVTVQLNANGTQENIDETVKKQNIFDFVSITTELPLLLATADFGVTISTEYAKTVTESETPAPLPEKEMLTARDEELLNTNNAEKNARNNDSILNWNKVKGYFDDKENGNGQIFVNTSSFVKVKSKNVYGNEEILNVTGPSLHLDISEVNKLVDNLLSNYSNSNVSLLSGNLTSSDFIYPSLETKMRERENGKFNYTVDELKMSLQDNSNSGYTLRETNIRGLELYNSSNTKALQGTNTSTINRNDTIEITIVEKQKNIIGTLKDRVATSSVQINPENEVRIMLGKLNALVRKALDSTSRSKPVLNEFSQAKSGSTIVNNNKMEISTFASQPTTRAPMFAVEQTKKPFFIFQPTTRAPIKQYPQFLKSNNVQKTLQSQVLQSQNLQIENEQPQNIQPLPRVNEPKETQASTLHTPLINPTVIRPPVKEPEAAQSASVQHLQSNIATIPPWWRETTLSPFSIDNLFGFTTQPPLIDNNWLNPTTSAFSWDAMFGSGGIPVTQGLTMPPYNHNQNMLNDIYNPLDNNNFIHSQDTAVNQHSQHTGYFGEGTFTTPPLLPSNNFGVIVPTTPQIRPTREVRPRVSTDQNVHTTRKDVVLSENERTTKSFSPFSIPSTANPKLGLTRPHIAQRNLSTAKPFVSKTAKPSTQKFSKNYDKFNIKRDSEKPGNFSIPIQHQKVTMASFFKPTIKAGIVSNDFYTATTIASPTTIISSPKPDLPKSKILELSAFPKITISTIRSANKAYKQRSIKGTVAVTSQRPYILSENNKNVKIVSDTAKPRPVTPKLHSQRTETPRPPVASIIQTFWNAGEYVQTTTIPTVTGSPTTVANYRNQLTTKPYWNAGSSRVLSSNIISNWWEQVQPTSAPPVYVTQATPTPTPTAVSNLDQCYQMQDTTGFCQSRRSGHYRNPVDCRSFYVCIWETLHSCSCPANTMFDDKINVCNWDHLVTCK